MGNKNVLSPVIWLIWLFSFCIWGQSLSLQLYLEMCIFPYPLHLLCYINNDCSHLVSDIIDERRCCIRLFFYVLVSTTWICSMLFLLYNAYIYIFILWDLNTLSWQDPVNFKVVFNVKISFILIINIYDYLGILLLFSFAFCYI
jgi:hypothetical protein